MPAREKTFNNAIVMYLGIRRVYGFRTKQLGTSCGINDRFECDFDELPL